LELFCRGSLGNAYLRQGKLAEARRHDRQAMKIAQVMKDTSKKALGQEQLEAISADV